MKRLLITGGSGYLGGKLVQMARRDWTVVYTYLNNQIDIPRAVSASLDILDRDKVLRLFHNFCPHAVIHTAYSQDNLEVIIQGTKHVAEASEAVGARLIHLSTDAVFDGARGWYREDDTPLPIHPYGKAKAEAERLVNCSVPLATTTRLNKNAESQVATALVNRSAAIVRTSLIWGLDPMDSITLHLVNCLNEGGRLALFTDEYRCPIHVDELASAILELLNLDFCGIIHVAGPERMSRYEFGLDLTRKLGLNINGITPGLSRLSELVRPKDCSLDTSLARGLLKTRISAPSELLA